MKKIYFLVLAVCFLTILHGQNPSDRDPNFNQFNLPINHYFVGSNVTKSEVLQDGKILLLENNRRLVRLNGNLIDNTFNTGKGFSDPYETSVINDFAVQSDGKIIVGGRFTSYNGVNRRKLIRLNLDGSIDSSFNINFDSEVLKIIMLSDGRIFLNTSGNNYEMKILNSDGSISFSYVIPSNYSYQGFAFQNDGKLIISRRGTGYLNFSYSSDIIRLNKDGSVDSSFNAFNLGNYFTGTSSEVSVTKKVLIQQDGKILVAGYFQGCLIRLNTDGSEDISFKTSGFTGDAYSFASINDLAIQKDNQIIIGGFFSSYGNFIVSNVLRLKQDGDLDPNFSKIDDFSNIKKVTSVSLFNDEKILVSGEWLYNGIGNQQDNYILQLNANGSKDNTFNNICKGFFGVNPNNLISNIVETKDNKILVGGCFISYNGIKAHNFLRLHKDGSLDDSFNLEKFDIFRGINDRVSAILPLPEGKIIFGAYFSSSSFTINKCIKLNEDGSIDSVFDKNSGNGFKNGGEGYVSAMLLLPDNSILVGGDFNSYNGISCSSAIVLDLDGKYKRNFVPSNIGPVIDLKSQKNDKTLVVTNSNIFRYNSDFTLDNTFSLDAKIEGAKINSINIQIDGKIMIFGDFTVNGINVELIRILGNGLLDDSFKLSRENIYVHSFAILLDQKIIITYREGALNYIESFNNDGSIDSSFTRQLIDSNSNPKVYSQSNGGVLLHGNFINYQEKSERGLVKLLGENYNYIMGLNKYDLTNNGCDVYDPIFKNLKINFSSNGNSFDYITNAMGNYSVALTNGSHIITPILENPNYFTVSPADVIAAFPTQNSPFTQNFCVTQNGIHPDLEVTLLPLEVARPGFDVKYKLVYKNKGNITQSGTLNLTFDDTVLDVVISNPVVSSQNTNNLSWSFSNLKPFETGEITFTLNVNNPMETPAVNDGDVLNLTATISSPETDETPNDNTFVFNHKVVNSLDPNDKTCLEGNIITPNLIGEYVHYMIRFENTGTYPAQNIVVKDMIDLSKFDISTLVPTDASHPYITKISEGNKVEFIFENINLLFDDASNDGYIAFKIKTKPTLVVGDSFTNEANIYFDYNFPVLTNKATSKFSTALGTQDFAFSDYFTIYPNPANEVLNVSSKSNIGIQSVAVYDILGQLVIALPNVKDASKIDVSNLSSGNYFLKIQSDKGSSSVKFIKN